MIKYKSNKDIKLIDKLLEINKINKGIIPLLTKRFNPILINLTKKIFIIQKQIKIMFLNRINLKNYKLFLWQTWNKTKNKK